MERKFGTIFGKVQANKDHMQLIAGSGVTQRQRQLAAARLPSPAGPLASQCKPLLLTGGGARGRQDTACDCRG